MMIFELEKSIVKKQIEFREENKIVLEIYTGQCKNRVIYELKAL